MLIAGSVVQLDGPPGPCHCTAERLFCGLAFCLPETDVSSTERCEDGAAEDAKSGDAITTRKKTPLAVLIAFAVRQLEEAVRRPGSAAPSEAQALELTCTVEGLRDPVRLTLCS